MKVVYIAGPYRGLSAWDVAANVRIAERLALDVWSLGVAVICPHANTANFDRTLPDKVFLDGDLELLARSDALITTVRWRESEGAKAEVAFAKARGIPVFHRPVDLKKWLTAQA